MEGIVHTAVCFHLLDIQGRSILRRKQPADFHHLGWPLLTLQQPRPIHRDFDTGTTRDKDILIASATMENVARNPFASQSPRNVFADIQRIEEAHTRDQNATSQQNLGGMSRTDENISPFRNIPKNDVQAVRNTLEDLRRAEVAQPPSAKPPPVEPRPLCPRRAMTKRDQVSSVIARPRNAVADSQHGRQAQMAPPKTGEAKEKILNPLVTPVTLERRQADPQGVRQRPRNTLADLQYQTDLLQAVRENVEENSETPQSK